jgi:hypothetical protein
LPLGTGYGRIAGIKLYRENKRERFLSEVEIGAAADGITEAENRGVIGPFAAAGLRLALFTGARSGEITSIQIMLTGSVA